jgi:hypothetical protein
MKLEEWAQVGDIVGGFSTGLGLLLAGFTVNRWRHEKYADKRSETAKDALLTIQAACGQVATDSMMMALALMPGSKGTRVPELWRELAPRADARTQALEGKIREWAIQLDKDEVEVALAALNVMRTFGVFAKHARDLELEGNSLGEDAWRTFQNLVTETNGVYQKAEKLLLPVARFSRSTVRRWWYRFLRG